MKKDIKTFIQRCDTCQRYKYETIASSSLLQSLSISDTVWTTISMDFIEGLPKSFGKDVILVVVDHLSKYVHFIGLAHLYTAASVVQAYLDNIYKLHDSPNDIVSDRDIFFLSNLWQ